MIRLAVIILAGVLVASSGSTQPSTAPKPDTVTPAAPTVGADGKKTGVLVPQGSVDPGINKGAPAAGVDSGAVMKPPGTAGGQPGAVAK